MYVELWGLWECVSRPYTVFICFVTAALSFLWGRTCQTPALVSSEGFSAFLHKRCPVVAERFSPTPWCWGGRLQTLVFSILKSKPPVAYRNELISTLDGGQISLDWMDNQASLVYPEPTSRPTVLIFHGLTGNSQQSYVLHAVRQASRHGYRCVVFHNRGAGGEKLLTPVTFCASNTSDVERAVQHVKGLYPQAPLLGVGVSSGGMLLINYLAHKGTESGMVASFILSVPWNAPVSMASLEEPLNWLLFNKYLTNGLCRSVSRNRTVLEKAADINYVLKSQTIREFDERLTILLFGYKSVAEYYCDASPDKKLPNTAVPILCLNAADDPFSPQSAFPLAIIQDLPNVALLVTAHGGHNAFLQGLFPCGENYMERVFSQFAQAVFEHPKEIKKACGINEKIN